MRLRELIVAGFAVMLPLSAQADTWGTFGAVQCGGSSVAIRFGGQMNLDPPYLYSVPKSMIGDWAASPVDSDARCELADGSVVVVRFGQQASSSVQGPGAMDPPAWVDVWINGRSVLEHEVYKSAGAHKAPWLNSIIVTSATITRCSYSEYPAGDAAQPSSGVACELSKFDLPAIPLDPLAPNEGAIPGLMTQRRDRSCDTDLCRSEAEWLLINQMDVKSNF